MKLIHQLYLEAVAKGADVSSAYRNLLLTDETKLKAAWPELNGRDPHLEVPAPSHSEVCNASDGWMQRTMYALYGYEGPDNIPGHVQNLLRVVSYQMMMGDGPTLFDAFPSALLGVQLACRMYDFQLVLRESLYRVGPAQEAAREKLLGCVKRFITRESDFYELEDYPGVATLFLKHDTRACTTESQEQEVMKFLRSVKRAISGVDNEFRVPLTLADMHFDTNGEKMMKRSYAELAEEDLKCAIDIFEFTIKDVTSRKIIQAFRRPISEGLGPIEDFLRITRDMLKRVYGDSKIPACHALKNVFGTGDHETREFEFSILVSLPFLMNMHLVEELAAKHEHFAEALGDRVPDKKRARTFCEQIADAFDKKPKVGGDSE